MRMAPTRPIRPTLALAWVLSACSGPRETLSPPPTGAAVNAGPALVVYIVVDQLPVRLLERLEPHFTGGLAALTQGSGYRATGEYRHAVTNTCPGHATLATGASPAVHGIVSNNWPDPAGRDVYCGAIALLRADTVADRVASAGGSVVSLSLKDRGVVFLGGRSPRALVTYDKTRGVFEGASWATTDLTVVRARPWTPANPEALAQLGIDDDPREGGVDRRTFPHDVSAPGAFPYSAYVGDALVEAAIAGVEAEGLGKGNVTDLLTVSFSNTDYVGHVYGTESWEAADALLGVDRALGTLFAHLDRSVGAGRWSAVLTSDHGSAAIDARRVSYDTVREAGRAVLQARGIGGDLVDGDPVVQLPDGMTDTVRGALAAEVAHAMAAVDGVTGAWAWKKGIPDDAPHADAIRASYYPGRSGDIFVLVDEATVFAPTGTDHGTPWAHDRFVPVLALGAGVPAGRADEPVDMRRIAPTIAALAGVPPPAEATEPALFATGK